MIMKQLRFYLLITLFVQLSLQIELDTINGPILGREHVTEKLNKPFYSFRGIPYAEVPVGALRFAPPVPKSGWSTVLNATEDSHHCNPYSKLGNEDCLFINVYTPTRPTVNCDLLPTLVYIHGGAFIIGTSSYESNGPDYFLEHDVVVVAINYRLGVFGYLSTDDEVISGNAGLKDQLLALQWVKANIATFCGDPNLVTLMGQSAGSASVSYLMQVPQAEGLFHRAIMHSGTTLNLWALGRNSRSMAFQIAADLGLNITDSASLLDALRNVDYATLQAVAGPLSLTSYVTNNPLRGLTVGPVKEVEHSGAIFTGSSHQDLIDGRALKVPVLLGYTSLEMNVPLIGLARALLIRYDKEHRMLVPVDLNIDPELEEQAAEEIRKGYFDWLPVSLSTTRLLQFMSEDQFTRPIIEYARLLKDKQPVYLYKFSYEGGLGGFVNKSHPGVLHSEDLGYFWRTDNLAIRDQDYVVRERAVQLWVNFIKTGNPTPTPELLLDNLQWDQFSKDDSYLDMDHDFVLKSAPEAERIQFWKNIYDKYSNPPLDTY